MAEKGLSLICVDASEHSLRALDWYFDSMYHDGDKVGLVHVHKLPDFPIEFGIHVLVGNRDSIQVNAVPEFGKTGELLSTDLYQQTLEQSITVSKNVVETFREKCEQKGLKPTVYLETMVESIGNTICQVAKDHNASVIVIGQRGIGAIRRTLFGSVSDYVLHHTHIPIVIVPPPV